MDFSRSEEQKKTADTKKAAPHKLELDGRRLLSVTGVKNVPSFSDKEIVVELDVDCLLISGRELEVKRLDVDNGVLSVSGFVSYLKYQSSAPAGGLMKKLFK